MELPSSSSPHTSASVRRKHYGSVRKQWRGFVESLNEFPALQHLALETASFFTRASEIEFHLPRTFHTKYALAEKLGEGAFGQVHRVVALEGDNVTANALDLCVKIVPKQLVINLKDYEALQQEGKMMMLLGGTLNVVHFFGAYEDDESVFLVMEHCVGGDASQRVLAKKEGVPATRTSESLVALYMTDILHVVWQCHLLRILHGDLKLENFLFADDGESSPLKLTDFGGASFIREHEVLRQVRGTPLYTAPEVLKRKYAFPSDLWSCGVILYRLLSGRFPFEEGALLDERILHEQIDFESHPWPAISPDAKNLVQGLLERNVNMRLSAEQALQHPWFAAVKAERASQQLSAVTGTPAAVVLLDGTMVQRLQLYRTLNSFQQAVFYELARVLPLELKEQLLVLFSELSRNGAMQVGISEFAAYLEQGGYRLTLGEARSFLRGLDLDGDGFLARDEFCAALLDWSEIQRAQPALWDALVSQVFAKLDADGDGKLRLRDLEQLVAFETAAAVATASHSFRSDMQRCFRQADVHALGWLGPREFADILAMESRSFAHFAQRLS